MRKFSIVNVLSLAIVLVFLSTHTSQATSTLSLCTALERPNIDCACVANRMEKIQAVSSSQNVKKLMTERYIAAVGADHQLESASLPFAQNPMASVQMEIEFGQFGGAPENITEFEEGCIIPNATPKPLSMPAAGTAAALYVEARVVRVGEAQRRNAICVSEKLSSLLSENELRAHAVQNSAIAYNDPNSIYAAGAGEMGLSEEVYKALLRSGTAKRNTAQEKYESYCSAITYADEITPEQNQAALKKQADMAESAPNAPDSDPFLEGDEATKARRIMNHDCNTNGGSKDYCQCKLDDFNARVVDKVARPGVALSWALMQASANMPQGAFLELNMKAEKRDQQAAAMMFMSTMDVGEGCLESQTETRSPRSAGTPEERMMKVCMTENENQTQTLCECTVGKMREKLNADDFELIVDIREAELGGAADPLVQVAKDRGLSAAETENAMMVNQSLIGGLMAMDLMSCVGGMPAMPDLSKFFDMSHMPKQ